MQNSAMILVKMKKDSKYRIWCLKQVWIPWQSGRDEDSRSMGLGFKSRRWANFQRLCRTIEIGIHIRHPLPSVNGELRGNITLGAR